jgi:hypothetical protein
MSGLGSLSGAPSLGAKRTEQPSSASAGSAGLGSLSGAPALGARSGAGARAGARAGGSADFDALLNIIEEESSPAARADRSQSRDKPRGSGSSGKERERRSERAAASRAERERERAERKSRSSKSSKKSSSSRKTRSSRRPPSLCCPYPCPYCTLPLVPMDRGRAAARRPGPAAPRLTALAV